MSWKTEDNLPETVTVKITDAGFDESVFEDEKTGETKTNLRLHLEVQQSFDGEVWKEFGYNYGIGKDWVIADGGYKVEDKDGKNRGFHKNSAYGSFIDAALECAPELEDEGDPADARLWIGKEFVLKRTEFKFPKLGVTSIRMLPVEYLGGKKVEKSSGLDEAKEAEIRYIAQQVVEGGGTKKQFIEEVAAKVGATEDIKAVLDSIYSEVTDLVLG